MKSNDRSLTFITVLLSWKQKKRPQKKKENMNSSFWLLFSAINKNMWVFFHVSLSSLPLYVSPSWPHRIFTPLGFPGMVHVASFLVTETVDTSFVTFPCPQPQLLLCEHRQGDGAKQGPLTQNHVDLDSSPGSATSWLHHLEQVP